MAEHQTNQIVKSARRAWHDVYYVPKDDHLARIQANNKGNAKPKAPKEQGQVYSQGWHQRVCEEYVYEGRKRKMQVGSIELMNAKDGKRPARDFFDFWDPIWRSRVQKAIRGLSKNLQSFGAIMYAPASEFGSADCDAVHDAVQREFFKRFDDETLKNMRAQRVVRLKLLIYAAMRRHRDVVFGGQTSLDSPKQISMFLYHMYMERLPSIQNWQEQWEDDWKAMLDILDRMEKQALAPVSQVVHEMMDEQEAA